MACPPWCGLDRVCHFCSGERERKLLKVKRCSHGRSWCKEGLKRCSGCKADAKRKADRKAQRAAEVEVEAEPATLAAWSAEGQ